MKSEINYGFFKFQKDFYDFSPSQIKNMLNQINYFAKTGLNNSKYVEGENIPGLRSCFIAILDILEMIEIKDKNEQGN